jgi:two-component system, response regulator PdtaR
LEKSSQTGPDPLFVLVVEDEVLLRYEMVEYLRDSGCLLLEASTAKEAVAMCCDGNVLHVLLTDINLEGPGSGWDVADALRAVRPGAGVVYVSGNLVDHSRRVARSLFFNKPYRASDILRACRNLAQTHRLEVAGQQNLTAGRL